jgi:uncharacterized protein
MSISRRDFIKNASIVSLGFSGLNSFVLSGCKSSSAFGYGALQVGEGVLSLPKGFSSVIISRKGDPMNDGLITPGMYDGMGAFKWNNGKVLLIRNHENTAGAVDAGPFGTGSQLINKISKDKIYDYGKGQRTCVGGTSTMIYNEDSKKVELSYMSLVGTIRNCAGGITPWNSWITCEETVEKKDGLEGFLEKDHGYNFEVPASGQPALVDPVPIKAMGRFIHEAVAVHPELGIVYQTEDIDNAAFYRYLPNEKGNLNKGGKLQCLIINEWKAADTRNWETLQSTPFPLKKTFAVSWIDMDNVEAPDNDLRLRAYQQGAARFARGEGIWHGKNELFFACTSGGKKGTGQIFRYVPSKYEGQAREKDAPAKLELFLEPNDVNTFQNCDNLTIAPWGDVIICEDKHDARIIGITPAGKTYEIAKNVGYRQSEFAGPVFSPSGKTLFVNIQSPGLTLAINGPWK